MAPDSYNYDMKARNSSKLFRYHNAHPDRDKVMPQYMSRLRLLYLLCLQSRQRLLCKERAPSETAAAFIQLVTDLRPHLCTETVSLSSDSRSPLNVWLSRPSRRSLISPASLRPAALARTLDAHAIADKYRCKIYGKGIDQNVQGPEKMNTLRCLFLFPFVASWG